MRLLFLTLVNINSINERNLYTDLMRKFRDEGHDVFIVTPSERRLKQKTNLTKIDGITLLKIKILNIQKTNLLEKGISTILIEHIFLAQLKKFISERKFDLIIYSTPPITFHKVIRYIKQRDNSISYLLLKDIFPQNAVDLGMIKKGGLIHRYFRHKEKQLYLISDFIGCMSTANGEFLLKHNPKINPKIIEVNPNSIELYSILSSKADKITIRGRFNIPPNSIVYIYGGNLGKPQGIDFLLEIIDSNNENKNAFFVIVGSGTEFKRTQDWFSKQQPNNAILIPGLPKNEYDQLVQVCDVGLIFLDKRFTIPNYPSRLLSYLENKMPVIAATDANTDIGKDAEKNNYGFWALSGNLKKMNEHIDSFTNNPELIRKMGNNGYTYLLQNFTVDKSYRIIMSHFNENV